MNKLNIKTRVCILALIPTIVTSLLLGTFLICSRIHDIEKEQHTYGLTLLNHIVNISRYSLFKNDRHGLEEISEILHDERELQSITFFNKDHGVVAYSGDDDLQNSRSLLFNTDSTTTLETKDNLTLIAPVIIDDLKLNTENYPALALHSNHKKVIGWVAISISKTKTILEEYQIIIFTLVLLALGIAISTFFAIRTSKHLTNPLIKIRQALKKIEKGELETRINSETGGEISELEDGINTMAVSLQKRKEEQQAGIEQATASLKQSLATIELQNTELARAQKEALEASRIKSEFIANMSHEIRTPMNSIVGYTNLLLETELSLLQRNYLTTIQKSTLSLLSLINNVLDFSRLEAGELKLDYIQFDLLDCIEDIMCIMAPLANFKQLEFAAVIDDDIPKKILSDPLRIKQIIINLVSNAIKFTDQGEITLRVMLEKKTPKSVKLRVSISDTGIGMTPHDQKSIFRAFQQADTSIARKYGGTGLGLAICKKLIDQMAGKMGVDSSEEQGSTFWFTFTADRAAFEPQDSSHETDFTHTSAILYEPHPASREAIKNILMNWKIQVMDFSEFDALMEYLKTSSTQATFLLAGINQQQIQNTSASEYLSTIKKYFSAPLIVCTNSSEQATLDYFVTNGAAASLSKPMIRKNLYHVIFQLVHSGNHDSVLTPSENQIALKDKHILCVDDNPQNTNLVKALLENTQAITTIAHDGFEALQLMENQVFDLILMDIRMPKLDGYETVKLLRSSGNKNQSTPVIAISAHISDDEQAELFDIGFNGYLIKPIIKPTLLDTIHQHIGLNISFKQQETVIYPAESQIIDWDLGTKLAGNKREFAEEMLNLLVKNLPNDLAELKKAKSQNDYHELLRRIHKLHGALCYCGVPRLKMAAALLETKLKQNKYDEVALLFNKLELEIENVLSAVLLP